MQERQVTIGEHTFPLEDPFWVLATQNPVEQEGVFSLPEAQLDRFAMMIRVHYPDAADEVRVLQAHLDQHTIIPIADKEMVVRIRERASEVHVDDKIRQYIVAIGQATRNSHPDALPIVKEMIHYGISTRSYHHLLAMARAAAFLRGRDFVSPDDVKYIAPDVMHHRMVRTIRAEVEGVTTDEVVAEVLRRTPIP
jgi:MoxR-like ATPase